MDLVVTHGVAILVALILSTALALLAGVAVFRLLARLVGEEK
jgi:hypothetical protein